jgi:hypothetical protein
MAAKRSLIEWPARRVEGAPARILAIEAQRDERGQLGNLLEQLAHLGGGGALVEGGDQLDGLHKAL